MNWELLPDLQLSEKTKCKGMYVENSPTDSMRPILCLYPNYTKTSQKITWHYSLWIQTKIIKLLANQI